MANDDLRINNEIRAREVRLIDEEGKMVGIVSTMEALNMAFESGLDLVEVSPNAEPPVCKIANYGKLKYQAQKKAADAKKKQKVVELKEIKMSMNIGKADYDTKMRQTKKFLEQGNKVKFTFKFKGREIIFVDQVSEITDRIIEETKELAKVDVAPKLEGKKLSFVIVPLKQ